MAGLIMHEKPVPNPEEFTSRYEYSKSTSRYHFDETVDDDSNPPFKRIGRFLGDWRDELKEMASAIRPNTYHSRMSGRVPYLDKLETNDLVNMGVGVNHVLHNKSIMKFTPTFQQMIDFLGFDQSERITSSFHIQMPGQVFIKHIDSCTSIRGNKASDDANYYFKHPEKLARFLVALEDWTMGHMWAYGNTYWKQWQAGDIVYHSWIDTPHCTANASHVPRYTLQVTGHTTERTHEIINSKEFLYFNV
jgi:hypothetical protein